jgi:hypothetical protein
MLTLTLAFCSFHRRARLLCSWSARPALRRMTSSARPALRQMTWSARPALRRMMAMRRWNASEKRVGPTFARDLVIQSACILEAAANSRRQACFILRDRRSGHRQSLHFCAAHCAESARRTESLALRSTQAERELSVAKGLRSLQSTCLLNILVVRSVDPCKPAGLSQSPRLCAANWPSGFDSNDACNSTVRCFLRLLLSMPGLAWRPPLDTCVSRSSPTWNSLGRVSSAP